MTSIKNLTLAAAAISCVCLLLVTSMCAQDRSNAANTFSQVEIATEDGLTITADLYSAHADKTAPFIVLCHQAGWSRGEYREIAPKLNALGFNCLAIDQRSGGAVNDVDNQTFAKAKKAKKGVHFPDAEQDMVAALKWVKANHAQGKVILWGSSYSAALSLRIAGEHVDLVDGAMAFSPGEYFNRFGKSGDWIATSARKIADPVFITSARNEAPAWKTIFESIPVESRTGFLPKTTGNHGSRALWAEFSDNKAYWVAVKSFLQQFTNAKAGR